MRSMLRSRMVRWLVIATTLGLSHSALAMQATLVSDAHVNAARPAVNSGAISNINVGGGYTGLIQFDLSLLPAGTTPAQVSRAVLRLYVNRVDTAGLVSVQPLNGSWGEYSVTYQTLPPMGSATQVVTLSQAGVYVAIDVTALVQGWLAAPATNFGIALTAGTATAQFDSKENDLTGHAPTLDVEVGSQGPAGPQGIAGPIGLTGPAGAPGPAGANGPAGPAGPIGPKGESGFTYQGTYSPVTNYALSDVVLYNGSSYISLVAGNRLNTPDVSPQAWGIVAVGGTGGGTPSSPTVGISYQGAYSAVTNYALNDIVTFAGSSYISLAASNHGNTPGFATAWWGLLAEGGAGVVGAQGPAGPTGPQGAQGLPGLGFEGSYSPVTNYGLDDVVSWQGSSYISQIASNHGNTPGLVPGTWALLAAAGIGTTGATGAIGPSGPPGLTGPQGQPGPVGATGVAGPQGAQGVPGLVYQGNYAATANYALGDVVLWQGTTYTSMIAGNHGNTPGFLPGTWGVLSAQGPQGLPGSTGAAGPTGVAGPLGPVGPPGEKGDQGAQGIPGQAGAQGIPGSTGAQGLSGPVGPQGNPGPAGLTYQGSYSAVANYALADAVTYAGGTYLSLLAGNHGNTPDQSPAEWALLASSGSAGASGPTGATGPAGIAGATGPQGPSGPQGMTGATGAQGPAAVNYTGVYSATTNYALHDAASFGGSTYVSLLDSNHGQTPDASPSFWALLVAQGAPGAAGPAGSPGLPGAAGVTGPVGPAGMQGPPVSFAGGWLTGRIYAIGDAVSYAGGSYIALTGNTGRQPDISPLYWGSLAQAGAAGPAGSAGPPGLEGPTGYPGPSGPQGPAGPVGSTGPAGPAGVTGSAGLTGPAGPAGAIGIPGLLYRGAYSAVLNYALNDAVTFGGSSYISLAANNSGNTPGVVPVWGLLATQGSAGAPGANGSIGATGAPGPQGPVGPAGPSGAAGAKGAVGINFRGIWTGGQPYAVSDAVTYEGSTYLAQSSNFSIEPDTDPSTWAILASAGPSGPSGATGTAASVAVGMVSTGAPGSSAVVTNSGTASAAVLNFTIPQGSSGVAGTGGGGSGGGGDGTSGIPYASTFHSVSFSNAFYSVNSSTGSPTEAVAVLTWIPDGCTASKLVAYSQQSSSTTLVTLRTGLPGGAMLDTPLSCTVASGATCMSTASVSIPAGSFVDFSIAHASGNPAGLWTMLACN